MSRCLYICKLDSCCFYWDAARVSNKEHVLERKLCRFKQHYHWCGYTIECDRHSNKTNRRAHIDIGKAYYIYLCTHSFCEYIYIYIRIECTWNLFTHYYVFPLQNRSYYYYDHYNMIIWLYTTAVGWNTSYFNLNDHL